MNEENIKEALKQLQEMLNYYKEGADWVIGKCREILKRDYSARIVLGQAYLVKGDFGRAALEAESVLSQDKGSIPAMLLLGEVFKNQGLCRKAVETFSNALSLDPGNLETQKKYGETRKKELRLEAESIKKRMADDEWKMSLHLDLAKIYNAINQREDAMREMQLGLKDFKRAPFACQLMGNFYREEGRFDLAASILKRGLESTNPDLGDISKKLKFSLALAYESQGLIKKALSLLEEIYQEDVDFPNLADKIKFLKASNLTSAQNKMLVAVPAFFGEQTIIGFWGREAKNSNKKQTLSVSFGQNYNNSGFDYILKGMNQAAQEEFTLCAQLDPNFSAGVNNLGVAHLISGRYEEGLHRFKDAFEIDPSSSIIANNIGLACYLLENNADAQKWLEKAIAVNHDLSAAYLNLGDVLIKENQAQKAIEFYKRITPSDVLSENTQRRLWGRVI